MNELVHLLLLAALGSLIALFGGIIFLYNDKLSASLQKHSTPFAAGVLITVSFLALIPESYEQIGETSLLITLLAFFGAYLFEHFIVNIHHHTDGLHAHHNGARAPVALVIVGDTIHNFIDGITIATSFFVNPGLGLVAAFSTFLHEVPHEISDFGILLNAKWEKKNIIVVNVLSAATTLAGALLTYLVAENNLFIGTMLAVSAGIFLYLGAIDFLPNIGKGYTSKIKPIIPLVLGIAVMLAVLIFVPHAHE